MKLTAEQKDNISVLVSNEVAYYETYQEVYDHMLTALEAKDTIRDLQKAYRDTLEEDFGGHKGIEILEGRQRSMIRQDMKQKRWVTFKWFFQWPGILIPLIYTVLCYYGFVINKHELQLWLSFGIVTTIFLPTIFIGIGNAIIAYKNRGGVSSIRRISTNVIARAVFLSMCWSAGINLLLQTPQLSHVFDLSKQAAAVKNNILICATFLGMCLYMVAIFTTYREEFFKRLKA